MKPANISKQRILGQARKLKQQKLSYLSAGPLEDDLYTWHFTFQGPEGTEFHEGLYHGQILLPYEYPFKPPDIVFMNKNGRFETHTKICLTITQYHPEEWNSTWTVRTMLEAVVSLFAENVQGVGSMMTDPEVRASMAKSSHAYVCEKCGPIREILAPRPPAAKQQSQSQRQKEGQKEEAVSAGQPSEESRIERKLSEERKEEAPLGFKRIYSEDQRRNIFEKHHVERRTHEASLKREVRPVPQIVEQRGEEEAPAAHPRAPEVIYIKDRFPIAGEYHSLSRTVKLIQSNLARLDVVNSSIRWV